jgi:hypothetical protein
MLLRQSRSKTGDRERSAYSKRWVPPNRGEMVATAIESVVQFWRMTDFLHDMPKISKLDLTALKGCSFQRSQ